MDAFWIPGIVAAIISAVISGIIVKLGPRLGIIDDPARHKLAKVIHEKPVPRGGGIPIFLTLVTLVAVFNMWDKRMVGIIIGAAILAGVGLADDIWEEKISPYLRLGFNVLAALAAIGAGVGIAYVTNPWGGVFHLDMPQICMGTHCVWIIADSLALVWLVVMQNLVGWSSGVDGQMPGFVVIAAGVMAILAARFSDPAQLPVIRLAAITAGGFLGFLVWNWYPQKILPGYGGKSLAGYLLGVLAILSSAKAGGLLIVLAIPFVDAVLVVIKRIKEGRSPVMGGYEHLHHYLLSMGWTKRKIAIFYWGVSGILALLALRLKPEWKWFTIAAAGLAIAGFIAWLHYFSTFSRPPDRGSGSKT